MTLIYRLYRFLKEEISKSVCNCRVVWFNDQFQSILTSDALVLIQFLPVNILEQIKDNKSPSMTARIFVITKIISATDAEIPDSLIEENACVSESVAKQIEGKQYIDENRKSRKIDFVSCNMQPSERGFLATVMDFRVRF